MLACKQNRLLGSKVEMRICPLKCSRIITYMERAHDFGMLYGEAGAP